MSHYREFLVLWMQMMTIISQASREQVRSGGEGQAYGLHKVCSRALHPIYLTCRLHKGSFIACLGGDFQGNHAIPTILTCGAIIPLTHPQARFAVPAGRERHPPRRCTC